jgi:hypothetical protein
MHAIAPLGTLPAAAGLATERIDYGIPERHQ